MGSTTCLVSNISIVSIKVKLFSFLDHNINQDTYDDDGGPGGHGGPGGPGGHGDPVDREDTGDPVDREDTGDPVDREDTGTRWIGKSRGPGGLGRHTSLSYMTMMSAVCFLKD